MRYVIENEELKVEVDAFGAELKSLQDKKTGLDYMWCADPEYYKRTSPNLFPIVGSLKDKKYRYGGREYEMGQHGFVRDMEWSVSRQSGDEICFSVESNQETLEKYPFAFAIEIRYALVRRELKITWNISNRDTKKMYYSFGGHPCFTCPIHGETDKDGYGYHFHIDGDIRYYGIDLESGLKLPEEHVLKLKSGRAAFTPDFFTNGAYIITGNQTQKISLYDRSGEDYLTVSFDAPMVGLWSAEGKNAGYAAIEPWFGRCDDIDFDGTLEERAGGNILDAKESFSSTYTITV